jgi:hypothetical protein
MSPVRWLKIVMTSPANSPELEVAWDAACEAGLVVTESWVLKEVRGVIIPPRGNEARECFVSLFDPPDIQVNRDWRRRRYPMA